jgi:hypothetical protein
LPAEFTLANTKADAKGQETTYPIQEADNDQPATAGSNRHRETLQVIVAFYIHLSLILRQYFDYSHTRWTFQEMILTILSSPSVVESTILAHTKGFGDGHVALPQAQNY